MARQARRNPGRRAVMRSRFAVVQHVEFKGESSHLMTCHRPASLPHIRPGIASAMAGSHKSLNFHAFLLARRATFDYICRCRFHFPRLSQAARHQCRSRDKKKRPQRNDGKAVSVATFSSATMVAPDLLQCAKTKSQTICHISLING
ncbi:hypothetical protein [Herbaspirillum sp. YR522]|uniref:hypothetical protein n=1 Tax=Herbaspirillum sp. YR522 TaxID=1144342 RepID=UPI0012FB034B|nr:hypothetical protein [Herbaspirillum sp. YR522]